MSFVASLDLPCKDDAQDDPPHGGSGGEMVGQSQLGADSGLRMCVFFFCFFSLFVSSFYFLFPSFLGCLFFFFFFLFFVSFFFLGFSLVDADPPGLVVRHPGTQLWGQSK